MTSYGYDRDYPRWHVVVDAPGLAGVTLTPETHGLADVEVIQGAAVDQIGGAPLMEPTVLRASIYDPHRTFYPGGSSMLTAPGATGSLSLLDGASSHAYAAGRLVSVDRDENDVIRLEWAGPLQQLYSMRGPDIPTAEDYRTGVLPVNYLRLLAVQAGVSVLSVESQSLRTLLPIPRGRAGVALYQDWSGQIVSESEELEVRGERLATIESRKVRSQRYTDLTVRLRNRETRVPRARMHADPWGVVNSGETHLTVYAPEGELEYDVGDGTAWAKPDPQDVGQHKHDISLNLSGSGSGTDSMGGGVSLSVSVSGTATASEETIALPDALAYQGKILIDAVVPQIREHVETFRAQDAASIARYGRREAERPIRVSRVQTTPYVPVGKDGASLTDLEQAYYLKLAQDVIALRKSPTPVYEIEHDLGNTEAEYNALLGRRLLQREELRLRGAGRVQGLVMRMHTRFIRYGEVLQTVWYRGPRS